MTEADILAWAEQHGWCEFPVVHVSQGDVTSVNNGFQLLFSHGMQLQETWTGTTVNPSPITVHRIHIATWTGRDEMREIFGLVDADNGGSIDKEEFHELMGVVGMGHLSKDQADAMIDDVDADGSGEIEFEEFIAVMSRKVEHSHSKEQVLQAFEFLGQGQATHGLRPGEARADKIAYWLNLHRPANAKLSVEECMRILLRAEKINSAERHASGAPMQLIGFEDFVELNS